MINFNKPGVRVVYTTPDGAISIDLHNPPDRAITSMTGLGMSDRTVSTVQRVYQTGETALSQNLVPRSITIGLRWQSYGRDEYLDSRDRMINIFRENRVSLASMELGTLTFTYIDDGVFTTRAINVYIESGSLLDPALNVWDRYALTDDITFIAPYPIFYDPTNITNTLINVEEHLVLGTGIPRWAYPFTLGSFSASTDFTYTGTWDSLVSILLVGSLKNVSVINESIDARINFAGEIASGTTVTISILPDEITALDSFGINHISKLSGDLNLFTVKPDPLVSGGTNTISAYAESSVSGGIYVNYLNWYRGI